MLFNSFEFLVFLAIVYSLYLVLSHKNQNLMLLAASYVFYGWWNWRFLSIIIFTTVLDYVVSLWVAKTKNERKRRMLLSISIICNLGLLAVFKYFNFFVESLIDLLNLTGLHLNWETLHIILPVGISFYTFQSVAYSIDVYRGQVQPPRRFLHFALFVAFFPQLVAGPIQRAGNLLHQIVEPRKLSLEQITRGGYLILFGLFKKMAIADGLAISVNDIFNSKSGYTGIDVLLATYFFVIQIYCDFSGYTDIARGVAKLMGFNLSKNFMTPFYAASPSEYWTRWHISLSSWVRDYVYLPLALHYLRKQSDRLAEYKPHVYAMLFMGLWHGAAWTYVLWGLYHACMLVLWSALRSLKPLRRKLEKVPRALSIAFYFQITAISLLIFRAESVRQIGELLTALVTRFHPLELSIVMPPLATLLGLPVLLALDFLAFRHQSDLFYRRWSHAARGTLCATLFILLVMGWSNAPADFIYFQF